MGYLLHLHTHESWRELRVTIYKFGAFSLRKYILHVVAICTRCCSLSTLHLNKLLRFPRLCFIPGGNSPELSSTLSLSLSLSLSPSLSLYPALLLLPPSVIIIIIIIMKARGLPTCRPLQLCPPRKMKQGGLKF